MATSYGRVVNGENSDVDDGPSQGVRFLGVLVPTQPPGEATMLACTLIFAAQSLVAKKIEERVTSMELVTYRSVLAGMISLRLLVTAPADGLLFDERLFGHRRLRQRVVLRGAVGASAFVAIYAALHDIGIGEHTALLFTNPIWISVFAWPVLGEKPTVAGIFALCCGAVGTLCVIQPTWLGGPHEKRSDTHNRGVALILVGSVLVAATMLVVRSIGTRVPALKLALSFHLYSAIFGSSALALGIQNPRLPRTVLDISLILLVSVSSFFGQPLLAYSFQYLPAARAASLNYLQLLWGFLLGAAAYHERPSWLQVLGASFLVVGGVAVALSKPR